VVAAAPAGRPGHPTREAGPAPLPRWAIAAVAGLAALNLLGALGGGLARLGTVPATGVGPSGAAAMAGHGAVMMAGFFGTLIALERVVALRRGLWVPVLSGLGGLAAWTLGAWPWAGPAWLLSALGLVGLYAWAGWWRALSLPLLVEASGALALAAAALAWWLGHDGSARLAWGAFLVLTIAGERRELTQLVRLPLLARRAFGALWALLGTTLALQAVGASRLAEPLWWATLGGLALWLLRYDLAPRQRRAPGWPGHTAVCLLVGYGWLLAAAATGLARQPVAWHLLWLGFVFAMVFGHAPIMLPALAGWRPRPTRWALLPLGLMGASLLLRALASNGRWPAALPWAGAGHALALAVFAVVMVRAVRAGQRG